MRRLKHLWLPPGLLLAAVLCASDGTAMALWTTQGFTAPLAIQRSGNGFAVTKDDTSVAATSPTDPVQFTIGAAEAASLVAAGPDGHGVFGVAVPFAVAMLVSGGYGLDYRLDIAQPGAGTVFGLAGASRLAFPVAHAGQCTVAAASSAPPYVWRDPVTGIVPGGSAPTAQTDHWCLVVTVTPPAYTNTASASGTNLMGQTETSAADPASQWGAALIPDPGDEPDLAVTVTPSLIAGSQP